MAFTSATDADLAGQPGAAATYRRRERATFVQFAGNRSHIDQQFGALIAGIAAVARGDMTQQAAIEAALPQFEANGWRIADATRRIWAGERDWDSLCEEIDLRVIETLADPAQGPAGAGKPGAGNRADAAVRGPRWLRWLRGRR